LLYSKSVTVLVRYDSVYLTCSKKLTGSQLSLPHVATVYTKICSDVCEL